MRKNGNDARIALTPARRDALAVGLEGVERPGGRPLDRRVVFLDRGQRLAKSAPQLPGGGSERLQHVVFARRLHLLLLDGVAGPAVRGVERDDVALAELRNRAGDHRFARGTFADLARNRRCDFFIRAPAHQPQHPLQPLLRQDAQERRLPQLNFERFLQRFVEDRLAGAVGEIGEHDRIALAEGARAVRGRIDGDGGDGRQDDTRERHHAPIEPPSRGRARLLHGGSGRDRNRAAGPLQPRQIASEIRRGLITDVAVLFQRLRDDVVEFRGRPSRTLNGGAGCRVKRSSKIANGRLSGNGTAPVLISYRTTPNENRSERPSISEPRACSGDM